MPGPTVRRRLARAGAGAAPLALVLIVLLLGQADARSTGARAASAPPGADPVAPTSAAAPGSGDLGSAVPDFPLPDAGRVPAPATPATAPVSAGAPRRGQAAAPAPAADSAPARPVPAAAVRQGSLTQAATAARTPISRRRWLPRLAPPAAPAVAPSTAAPVDLSRATAAPAGDLPGWKQVFLDDFVTPVPLGSFMTSPIYSTRWTSYDGYGDTSGVGLYAPDRVLSVRDGSLDMYLHTEGGRPLGAAPVPLYDGTWGGQTYGRFSIRFRADPLPGYGTGWLLWPDSDNWAEGEIDFPEGDLDKHFWAHNHCVGDPERSCWSKDTLTSFADWHTATIEWVPGAVSFFLDGRLLGTSDQAPSTAMHLVLQTATTGVLPDPTVAGHVQIDWVAIWARDA